jgi:hypothetical protein
VEYIRYGPVFDAYLVNWQSNVFPESSGAPATDPASLPVGAVASRKNNGEKPEPVAICRLKRVAADNKGDVQARMPKPATQQRQAHCLRRRRAGLAHRGP